MSKTLATPNPERGTSENTNASEIIPRTNWGHARELSVEHFITGNKLAGEGAINEVRRGIPFL